MKSRMLPLRKNYGVLLLMLLAAVLIVLIIVRGVNSVIAVSSINGWPIEPPTPQDIDDPPFHEPPLPSQQLPVSEVLEKGEDIPLQFAYNDPDWKRQAYKSYWHSSTGRWSYVPSLLHYAMHRLFVTYPTASIFYDFIHELGIAEESDSFTMPSDSPFENIILLVMQTKVEKIVALGNQVVVVGRPSLTGLQALLIPVKELKPNDTNESILFELATSEGDAFDTATLFYATDLQTIFWSKIQ